MLYLNILLLKRMKKYIPVIPQTNTIEVIKVIYAILRGVGGFENSPNTGFFNIKAL